ncbi:MAG: polysaccharide biosynthesis tyrosine autokinase [Pseudomonadota bacterium]
MSQLPSAENEVHPDQALVVAQMRQQLSHYEERIESLSAERTDIDDDLIDVREYWAILVRRQRTVFATVVLLLIGTLIVTSLMEPVFRATTVLQIERESGKVLEYQSLTAEEAANTKDFYQTQYELLKSRTLARRVIDQLGLQTAGAFSEDEQGILELIKSLPSTIFRSQEQEEADDYVDLEKLFLENLTVQPIKNSRLVTLHYESPSPEEAAIVANTLASSFVNMNLERRFDASTYAKGFLEERIKQVRADLEDSEKAMVDYTQSRGIINHEDKLGILTEKLKEMNRAQVQVEAQRIEAESQYQEMLVATTDSLAQMLESPVIQSLKAKRSDLQFEYKELGKIYKPAYPKMTQIQEQLVEIDREIGLEIAEIRNGIQVKYQSKLREEAKLADSIEATRDEILGLQQRSTDFQTLKREVETNRELYDGLLQRMKEVGVTAGVATNNISVIDVAEVPRVKYKPSLGTNLAIALVLGVFGGVLLAFLFDTLDDTVKAGSDLEKLIDKPVLGVIPLVTSRELGEGGLSLFAHSNPTSGFAEAYRSMRTALMFSTAHGAPKVLHFTSMNASEGKTTTAISVAVNFVQTGSKVLLIDADLRNPSLHRVFDVRNDTGLTNYLAGDAQPAGVTRATAIKDLFVLPSGPIPPNPAELLTGGKMVELARLGSERFDYVFIDSPPLLGLADALILADVASATLLVAAAGSTRTGGIEAGLKRLRHTRTNILGTVLTKFPMDKANYGYDYHYSYSYGASSAEGGRA